MKLSNIMKAAHKLAKTFTGDYRACLALAMKEVYKAVKIIIAKAKLEKSFDGSFDGKEITLRKNTFSVKETLKEIGFKFNSITKYWSINSNDLVSVMSQI